MDYDRTNIAATYNKGRDLGPAVLQLWMDAVASHIQTERVRNILDLGCGTGRFTQGLSHRFACEVVGLDPSLKMLAQAELARNTNQVFYACGSAEEIPLPPNSMDLILISMVFHHFTNPAGAARECWRVLRAGGSLCLRTASKEQVFAYAYVPFFPTSLPILEEQLPSIDFQRRVFEESSFDVVYSGLITQEIAPDYGAYADKLATRSDSILLRLNDDDFEAGIRALRSAKLAGPIVEPIDFIVFEKSNSLRRSG